MPCCIALVGRRPVDHNLAFLLPDRPLHRLPCPHGHHHRLTKLVGLGNGHRLLGLVQRDLVAVAGQACVCAEDVSGRVNAGVCVVCAQDVRKVSKTSPAQAATALRVPIRSTP